MKIYFFPSVLYPAWLLKAGCMFCCCFLFFKNCSCLTNYPKIYQSDLCQIVKLGRTVAVDDQSEISFSIPRGTLQWQPSFAGAARWSDIGLCPAFSSKWFAEAQPAVGKVR